MRDWAANLRVGALKQIRVEVFGSGLIGCAWLVPHKTENSVRTSYLVTRSNVTIFMTESELV